MKYAVALGSDFKSDEDDTYGFCYYEHGEHELIYYVEANSKEEAATKYLSHYYDHSINELESKINRELMNRFVEGCCGGNDLLPEYENKEAVLAFSEKVRDSFFEKMAKFGAMTIHVNRKCNVFATSFEENCFDNCVNETASEFPAESLIKLLSEKERKEGFIQENLFKVVVIKLKDL